MDPKGSNLASTDLLEISQLVSGSYVTKSITGAQIAASAPATAWGTITGTLSAQTDLNTALSGKQATVTLTTTGTSGASTFVANTLNVPTYSLSGLGGVPTTRTLTINGTTQDLSADRTFTISTGITIGTTAITSGTVGRVLFEGTGNVVQESANLFWDNTNGRLGIGTATPTKTLDSRNGFSLYSGGVSANSYYLEATSASSTDGTLNFARAVGATGSTRLLFQGLELSTNTNSGENKLLATSGQYWTFYTNGSEKIRVNTNGNVLINTTTDAGFKVDINGTARVQGLLTGTSGITISGGNSNVYGLALNAGGVGALGQGMYTDGKTNVQISQGPRTNGGAAFLFNGYGGQYDSIQLVNNGTANSVLIQGTYTSSNQPVFNVNFLNINNTLNFTTGTNTVKGIYYNPTLTSLTGTTHYAFHSTSGRHRYENLPTSPTGLASGDLWNNLGVLQIV